MVSFWEAKHYTNIHRTNYDLQNVLQLYCYFRAKQQKLVIDSTYEFFEKPLRGQWLSKYDSTKQAASNEINCCYLTTMTPDR